MVAHVERFLLELGSGFAFVGRQVPLEVGGDDFKRELLKTLAAQNVPLPTTSRDQGEPKISL